MSNTMPRICPLFYTQQDRLNPICGCQGSLNQGHGEHWHPGKCSIKLCEKNGANPRSRTPYLWCTIFSTWFWEGAQDKRLPLTEGRE